MSDGKRIEWFGQAGHFCAAKSCRFHLHTHVNGYCVSTVGDYHPPKDRTGCPTEKAEEIGLDRLYETMVFKLDVKGETNGNNLDFAAYNDRDAANAGHAAMVAEWSGK